VECLGTRTNDPRTFEALEPADKKENVFQCKQIRPKQKNTMILEGMPVNCMNNIKVGDAVTVLPSTESKVTNIHFFDKQFDEASVGSSITIELENDINVQRRYDCKII
jgi:sulfate adenylyltransferase subunit 1